MFRNLALAVTVLASSIGRADDKPETIKIDPETFAAEVTKDAKAATAKYKGKLIELAGRIAGIQRNASGEVFLSLPSKSAGVLGVTCFVKKDQNVFGKVVKGQKVIVRGRYPDQQFGVQLLECEIIKKGESPALTYTAEDFAKEWAKDKEAAAKKWKDKPIIVSGLIIESKGNDVGAVNIYLKAPDKKRVDCGFTAFEKDLATKLVTGQEVTVVGEFQEFESSDNGPALRFCLPVKK
jgi:tRNA_anti-like